VKEKFWDKCGRVAKKQLMLAFESHAPATATRKQKAKAFEAAAAPYRRASPLNSG
jgi:hypothetical protein